MVGGIGRALAGGLGGGPGGCRKAGVAIGGERSGNGSDGGDFGLLGDGVGVGGGAPWGFGLGPHGGGNGEGDGGGGGFTLADCCWGCVCSFAGRISAGSNGIVNFGGDLADINCFM